MERRRLEEGGRSAGDFPHEARVIGAHEQRRLVDSAESARGYSVDFRALESLDRQRLLGKVMTEDQRESLSNLLGQVSQLVNHDARSQSYRAWWGQLEGLVRQVQSTRARSLSDAEWNALIREVFVAWEETGIRKSQLRVSADRVRERAGRPTVGETTRAALGDQLRSGPRYVEGPRDSPFS